MKLVTYTYKGSTQLGVFIDEYIVNIGEAYRAYQQNQIGEGSQHPEIPSDMLSFLQSGEGLWEVVKDAVDWVVESSVPDVRVPQSEVVIQAPLSNPSKVIGIGLNYADHCREQNIPLPESVLVFAKFPSSIIGPQEHITWDEEISKEVDYEAELAVIIGREAFRIEPEEVWEYIAGYSIVNDISARDVQFADRQWVRGKSFDTFCPIGPYLVTRDEITNPHNLSIKTRLNGKLVQDSSTKEMVFKIPEIVAFITKSITLIPGDIICTGTPDGVGYFRDPKILLKPGDVLEIEIEGLGILRNPVM